MSELAPIDYPPHADAADRALFDRARQTLSPCADWKSVSEDELAELSHTHGIDFATAWWCEQIRRPGAQAQFVRRIESGGGPPPLQAPTIVLVPGAFYREHDHTGADGRRVLEATQSLGWPMERAAIRSFGSLEANAQLIIKHLMSCESRRIVLVSLSKGSADVSVALRHPRALQALRRVCGWVSISGITTGTPLVAWLRSNWLRTIGVHLLLWGRGQRFRVIDQLRRAADGPLAHPINLPVHLQAIHVVGCPLRRHLKHRWAPRGYERVAPLGPTDGGGILLADLARLPGVVYPVWGADHYLQPEWDVLPLIRNILLHAARSHNHASPTPTSRSTA